MKKSYLEKVFAVLLVITMQTVYMKLYNGIWDLILNGLLILVGLLLVVKNGKLYIPLVLMKRMFMSVMLFLLIPVFHIIFLQHIGVNYSAMLLISVLCTVLFFICVLYFNNNAGRIKVFMDNLSDAVFGITLLSLILYFVGQVFHLIPPTNTVKLSWGSVFETNSYFNLLFTPQAHGAYHSFKNGRFSGIYTEPPMCAFMLCISLINTLFVSERKVTLLRIIVICVAIYVTVSTTGYIIALLAVGFYVFLQKPKPLLLRTVKVIVSGLAAATLAYIVISLYQRKMVTDIQSVAIRSNNFESAIRYFMSSPIFGYGFKSDTLGITGGDTSVLSQVLQHGGILFALWYFLPIIKAFLRFIYNKEWKYAAATTLYGVMIYVTIITYTGLSIAFVAVFFTIAGLPLEKKLQYEKKSLLDKVITWKSL